MHFYGAYSQETNGLCGTYTWQREIPELVLRMFYQDTEEDKQEMNVFGLMLTSSAGFFPVANNNDTCITASEVERFRNFEMCLICEFLDIKNAPEKAFKMAWKSLVAFNT